LTIHYVINSNFKNGDKMKYLIRYDLEIGSEAIDDEDGTYTKPKNKAFNISLSKHNSLIDPYKSFNQKDYEDGDVVPIEYIINSRINLNAKELDDVNYLLSEGDFTLIDHHLLDFDK